MDSDSFSRCSSIVSSEAPTKIFDVGGLGQVFTPESIAQFMSKGLKNLGRILEPSCGDGIFLRALPSSFDVVGIEIDHRHCPPGALNEDFFAYPISEKFDSIIGNPPYVRFQDISPTTTPLLNRELFDERSNLYLFFIEKAIRHLNPNGELVFITPRDFMKATSAIKLNRWLYSLGTITHAIELGDSRVFNNAVPNCLIWRFELGDFSRITHFASIGLGQSLTKKLDALCDATKQDKEWSKRKFIEHSGHLIFARNQHDIRLADIASVKVGAVSGDDRVFANERAEGTTEFVCSATAKTGKTRPMLWCPQAPHSALFPYKNRLLSRRIKAFDESNWWHWGRGFPQTDAPRIYVNAKTRNAKPFFLHPCNNFDGAVLAIFPRDPKVNLQQFQAALNGVDWEELGFVCDGRFLFTQRSLENAPLPESFRQFLLGHREPTKLAA